MSVGRHCSLSLNTSVFLLFSIVCGLFFLMLLTIRNMTHAWINSHYQGTQMQSETKSLLVTSDPTCLPEQRLVLMPQRGFLHKHPWLNTFVDLFSYWSANCLHPFPNLMFLIFIPSATPVWVMVLICISLMTSELTHLLMCFYDFVNYPFTDSVQFFHPAFFWNVRHQWV